MKKLWPLLIIITLLLSFVCTVPLMAEEERWELKIGEETYLITKVPETGVRYIPEALDLKVVSANMETAIKVNPISVGDYMVMGIDWMGELLKRFARTAKPMVGFMDEIYPGVEITIYEQPKWVATWGVIYQIEGGEMKDQPSFIGAELREFPVLAGLADIFTKLRPGVMYVDKRFWFQLSYEFTEE